MSFKIGQTVKITPSQIDEDTGTDISGWCGRVVGFDGAFLEIQLDSLTLQNLPVEYIVNSIEGGYEYFTYVIEPKDVKAVPPRDKPEDVQAMREKIEAHYETKGKLVQDFRQSLLSLLHSIKGSGAFVAWGVHDFVPPGLYIEGLGEIGLPLTPLQAKSIIAEAKRAPFGQSSRTITDTTVRSAWEIDAGKVSFANPAWEKLMLGILGQVKTELGIEKNRVGASLYKLLLYETGDFFLPHRDSEKENGMFGTLVVGLPGTHTGGELIVGFDGREKRIDFSEAASNYQIPYAAFYADCEHEIKPVTSGYRMVLVYNLVHQAKNKRITSPQFSAQTDELSNLLKAAEAGFDNFPAAVLLGHQYTPSNFSLSQLKLDDRPRAEALLAAADKAGYFAKLGLVTHYRMGELESDFYYDSYRRRGRYYDDDEEDEEGGGGSMGEVYEEYTTVEHWADDDDRPGLGDFSIRDSDIISDMALGEGDPDEQEEEGYTGNAGMTVEYWYHYGAVFFWPKRIHANVLAQLDRSSQLQWLDYYARKWDDQELDAKNNLKELLKQMHRNLPDGQERHVYHNDFSPIAAALARLQDEKFLRKTGVSILGGAFRYIQPEQWLALMRAYDPALLHPAFLQAAGNKRKGVLRHLLEVLVVLDSNDFLDFVNLQMKAFPAFLKEVELYKAKEPALPFRRYESEDTSRRDKLRAIVANFLALSHYCDADAKWREDALEALCKELPREYVNDVLIAVLTAEDYNDNPLAAALREICREDLLKRTAVKPTPLPDWSRPMPSEKYNKRIWDILRPFLSSPTQQVFDYRAPEAERKTMETAIRSVTIDLKMDTITIGRPYTLRLTKTQAAYERALSDWWEDMRLLEKI